jgi:hypothetical protein
VVVLGPCGKAQKGKFTGILWCRVALVSDFLPGFQEAEPTSRPVDRTGQSIWGHSDQP